MSDVQVRPFRRGDRDQLTDLVNAHAGAVVPGMSVSVNTVLGSLERQPGEFIVDPWVSERVTLVAEQRSRVAAAAHLLRYYPDDRAGPGYRDTGEIRWLLYWPLAPAGNPCWPDVTGAAEALIAACIEVFGRWGVTGQSRRRGTAGARRVRGARAVAAHRRALPAGRVLPHRAHRDRLPGPGRGPAWSGRRVRAAAGRADGAPVGRDQRLPPVRRARRRRRSATSRRRSWTPESGCPGTAAGPTSVTCASQPRTGAAAWDPGCSGRPPTGSGWPR